MKKNPSTDKPLRFVSILEKSGNKLWGGHFRVPARIAEKLADRSSRRVVCTLNDSMVYQCAILPFGKGVRVISVNKKIRDTLGLGFGDEIRVSLARDTSTYGLPVPDEFRELLRQDAEGDRLFHGLSRGKQRTLLYMIAKAKNSAKRIEQALIVVNHLKINFGKIDYRKLSTSLRKGSR